jgi:hypothetical protein
LQAYLEILSKSRLIRNTASFHPPAASARSVASGGGGGGGGEEGSRFRGGGGGASGGEECESVWCEDSVTVTKLEATAAFRESVVSVSGEAAVLPQQVLSYSCMRPYAASV